MAPLAGVNCFVPLTFLNQKAQAPAGLILSAKQRTIMKNKSEQRRLLIKQSLTKEEHSEIEDRIKEAIETGQLQIIFPENIEWKS